MVSETENVNVRTCMFMSLLELELWQMAARITCPNGEGLPQRDQAVVVLHRRSNICSRSIRLTKSKLRSKLTVKSRCERHSLPHKRRRVLYRTYDAILLLFRVEIHNSGELFYGMNGALLFCLYFDK
jgi:hypothetical protein